MGFKSIDPADHDWHKAVWAQKTAMVTARPAEAGEPVITRMTDGHIETQGLAPDGAMIVTNPRGEEYIVDAETFSKRYQQRGSVFTPRASPVRVLKIDEHVRFQAPWGEEMRIARGVLVMAGENDIYGIQGIEFAETYDLLEVLPSASFEDARTAAEDLLEDKARRLSEPKPFGGEIVRKAAELVKGVEVDLEQPLQAEDE
ncbi:hypothetical protein [Salipiger mucosus]|uniref:Uncharacterized protein n=1 Tax=Salipiger mucosus DSM 16094 TaxID=1123237 RepID=S9QDN8_9RHOB|nr:hypothetical protein [Salipiger mucosus]EPX78027.1 hypothetical protein Salmuc_03349 [Salipiger mucosus DSM 16094]